MAVLGAQEEIWKIMTEYKEMPGDVKLMHMHMLMSEARTAIACREPMEHFKKEFQEMLHSLSSVELVRQKSISIARTRLTLR